MQSGRKQTKGAGLRYPRLSVLLKLRQDYTGLLLVFAVLVLVAGLAGFVALEEEDLAQAFVGVDLCRQRGGVRDLERNEAFPFRLERGDVHDDAAAGVSGFAHADGEPATRNAEIFARTSQGERVRRDHDAIRLDGDERLLVKFFRVND